MPIKKPPDLPNLDMSDRQLRDSNFSLSDSGTFSKDHFSIKADGMTQSPYGDPHNRRRVSLDKLVLERPLGTGSSAVVKLVRDPATGHRYALKQLGLIHDTSLSQQVVNELKVFCSVESDHLVRMFDAFYRDGSIFLALEYMNAGSLEDVARICGGRVPPTVLAEIVLQMIKGLIYLHRETHHLHRDLKPANVLLNASGEVKLSDFGISRQLEHTGALAGTFCGTAQYMSPERIVGQGYSWPSDIWCVGLIAVECATGEHPYERALGGSNYFDLVKAIVEGPEPTSSPGLPGGLAMLGFEPEFWDFVHVCTQKDPSLRPSALQLLVRSSGPALRSASW